MLGAELEIAEYVERISAELAKVDRQEIQTWSDLVFDAWQNEKFIFVIGNGGSATSATHFSEDLGKSTLRPHETTHENKRRLKILSLTDNQGWIMAVANDLGYEHVFVQQLMHYGSKGDLLIAISGSGNSPNVLSAVDWANRNGLKTFSLTGYDGGKLRRMAHAGMHVPLDDMGMVESIHLALFHWVLGDVYARMNGEGRYA